MPKARPLPLAKLSPILNAVWDPPEGEAAAAAALAPVCDLLIAAARRAAELWPEFYAGDLARARLILSAQSAAAAAFAQTAAPDGVEMIVLAAPFAACLAQSDLVVGAHARLGETGGAPLLATGGDGASPAATLGLLQPRCVSSGDRTILLAAVEEPATPDALARLLLAPPRRASERRKILDAFAERGLAAPRFEYDVMMRIIGAPPPQPDAGAIDEWGAASAVASAARPDCRGLMARLAAEHDAFDALALRYGALWRSNLVSRSFLSFLTTVVSSLIAVVFANVPLVSTTAVVVQFATNIWMFADRRVAIGRRWRGRWVEYRALAEQLRLERFLALAGTIRTERASQSWLDFWCLRIVRTSPPIGAPGEDAAVAVVRHLRDIEIERQIGYQRRAFRRFRRLDTKMKRAGTIAMSAAVAVGALFALFSFARAGMGGVPWQAVLSVSLVAAPSLLATLNGVRLDFDVARQAERAARLATALAALLRDAAPLPPTPDLARALATRAADIMLDELRRWRIIAEPS